MDAPAVTGPAAYALLTPAIQKFKSPSRLTMGNALAELDRQGVDMKAVIAWCNANPRASFWDAVRAMKPVNVIGQWPCEGPSAHQRGDASPSRNLTQADVDAENRKWAEAERTPSAIKHRGELIARLRAAGIRVENEERV